MPYFKPPLEKMRITQPYGVNWTGVKDMYSHNPAGLHSGLDLRAPKGTPVYAPCDGLARAGNSSGGGKSVTVRYRSGDAGVDFYHGHLSEIQCEDGTMVKQGDLIALSGNTGGKSTAPHLHWGARPLYWRGDGSGPFPSKPGNGYRGRVNPILYLPPTVFALPVDLKYSSRKRGMNELKWYVTAAWFYKEIKKLEGKKRLPTNREKRAFVYGYWDFRTVTDPAMFSIWTEMTKPEYLELLKQY